MKRRYPRAGFTVLVLVWLAACGPGKQAAEHPPDAPAATGQTAIPDSLRGTNWVLAQLGETRVLVKPKPTLNFGAKDEITGKAGCNGFSGRVLVDGDKLEIGPLMATKMACAPDVMHQETSYLKALEDAQSWSLKGGDLEMAVPGFSAPIRFERATNP